MDEQTPYQHLTLERLDDVWCARLTVPKLSELELEALGREFVRLTDKDGCRKLVLSLGPQAPEFLYSVFLAKLVSLRRRLMEQGGAMKIAEASNDTREIFAACHLDTLFDFVADREAAVAALCQG